MSKTTLNMLVEQANGVSVVSVQGPVDSATLEIFKNTLDPLCLPPGARVLLDCRQLTYMNSRAIGLLVKYHRSLMMTRGRFALYGLSNRLVHTLDLLQLGQSLVTFPTEEEALAAMR